MKVVWIISASDLRIWRRVFDIHADVDNPNPIVCGCGLGYGVSDIRRIWIIRYFNADNPRPIIGYPSYDNPIRLIHYDLLPIHNFLAHKILATYIYIVCTCIENLNRSHALSIICHHLKLNIIIYYPTILIRIRSVTDPTPHQIRHPKKSASVTAFV
jgi:hypothetical protein